ncbi:ABC transporter ATP-binding protein [Streptomyces thermodiastaticus]|uniref:ABC transporter ATP-binding protein n=1 Tax=Streptomyces thermodiastaticus TaxID=44061 RepID=UPI0019A8466B|nr:ATP-binding cassette domain-containing protein [Streptomyces thermodiastaticus]MCE7551664.1 ATP-binding cassette domain-containing protein [Streptomyces thermodiastaticus]GHF92682.1 ABC transporter ATP-binding protein [Streptomyces thermodiastaticus]
MKPLGLEGVSKRFGSRQALDALTFTVRPGEIFGFVGGNGAGKTTAMRIGVGVLAPDRGHVLWGEVPVGRLESARFGYMPEERGLYPKMTVARQLVYLGELHGLSRADAREAMLRWTERLRITQHRDKRVDTLSLGNQQRVQLAAALVHDPELLILDEPFSGLDPLAVDDMSAVLRDKAAQGVPVLFSSHQLELVEQLCDRVGIVRAGRLAACGTLEELRSADTSAQVYVEVEGAGEDWPSGCAAAAGFRTHQQGVLVDLAAGCTENDLLREAVRHGTVRQLRRQVPTLAELFRDLVEPAGDPPPTDRTGTGTPAAGKARITDRDEVAA